MSDDRVDTIRQADTSIDMIRFCLDRGLLAWRATSLGPWFEEANDGLNALRDLVEAARLIRAYDEGGGDEWWGAHADLYAALERAGFGRELDGGEP